ncbi:MAG: phenylacetate--CoA ligase family protein [Comamonadaceae bacterium]|jgi:phenylacetate-CoA ligase|nr:phenylacetate--CoA ligase family protein [Comamonadaceae bacterium]
MLREGRGLRDELQDLARTERLDAGQLQALQLARLRERLVQAGREVPFYRALFARLGFDPRDFNSLDQLACLPILEKAQVQAAGAALCSDARIGPRFRSTSSGTTGSHLQGWRDLRSIVRENAFIWRQLQWAGVRPGDRRAWLRGDKIVPAAQQQGEFWRLNRADRLLMLSSYHLTPARVGAYVEALERFDPVAIQAYPSALVFIAAVLDAHGRRFGQGSASPRRLRAIVTSSETLLPAQRQLLERVFGCRVFDWYGAFERVAAIGTCEEGNYHLLSDYGYAEWQGAEGGQDLIGTGFDNRAMPLLRYRLNDRVLMEPGGVGCPCGRAFPRVRAVLGRGQDVLYGVDGHRVFMPANVFDDLPGLVAGQWRQHRPGHAELLLQFQQGRGMAEADVEAVARRYTGEAIDLEIRRVDRIERTAAGKLPAVVHEFAAA